MDVSRIEEDGKIVFGNLTPVQLKDDDVVKGLKLFSIVKKFIDDNQISCAEVVSQADRVVENSYAFIMELCEIVGYYKYPEDYSDE